MNLFKPSFLFASLFWGSVGVGYFIYGRRRQALSALVGGIVMIAVSCLVGSALLMSLICVLLVVAIHLLLKRDY